jgi:hypothetical protein
MQDLINELDGAQEPTVLEAGIEAKIHCIAVNSGEDKNGLAYAMPVYEFPDEPLAKECSDFMYLLTEDNKDEMSPKQWAKNLWKVKTCLKAMDIDYASGFDMEEDLVGQTGWAIVGVRNSEDYGEQNTIRKYVMPG